MPAANAIAIARLACARSSRSDALCSSAVADAALACWWIVYSSTPKMGSITSWSRCWMSAASPASIALNSPRLAAT